MEVIQGLSQAAANAYDGALDENGNSLDIGLRREEGNPSSIFHKGFSRFTFSRSRCDWPLKPWKEGRLHRSSA